MEFTYNKNVLLWIKDNADLLDDIIEGKESWDRTDRIPNSSNTEFRKNKGEVMYFLHSELGMPWSEIFKLVNDDGIWYDSLDGIPVGDVIWTQDLFKHINGRLFHNSGITSFTSTKTDLYSTGDYSFVDCPELKSIKFASLYEVYECSIAACPKLNKLILPDGLEKIGRYNFGRCPKLKILELPQSIDYIAPYSCPEHGKVKVRGLTKEEAADFLKNKVRWSAYVSGEREEWLNALA